MNQAPTSVFPSPSQGWNIARQIGTQGHAVAFQPQMTASLSPPLTNRKDWLNSEYREAYMESCVEQNIAWQISLNRKERKLSQRDLAEMIGTKQSAISRYEDPSYGCHSIEALTKIAHAFECALLVKLIPFSELAVESSKTGKESFLVRSYSEEMKLLQGVAA